MQCFKAVAIVLSIKGKFSKSFVDEDICQYLEIATKEILIYPTTDHQQKMVLLSKKMERNKQLSLLIS